LDEIVSTKLHNRPLTRKQLLDLAVVHSDNQAAKILCETYPGGMHDCVSNMNFKAFMLQMPDTKFVEPTGLSNFNVSTAQDLLKLVSAASKYPEIVSASNTSSVRIASVKKKKTFWQEFHNTNPTVGHGIDYLVSKTGYINSSGGCIVMMLNTVNGIRTVVLLGSKNTKTRIPEAQQIAYR
jgi:D-alanyl-D-alanine endopeptidase (penicillin-binding protein 7)